MYCPGAQCCSQYGYCGTGSPWCDNNPNSAYNGGKCGVTTTTCTSVAKSGGSCGAANKVYCPGSQCCSQWGYCGVGSPWCDTNPNSGYNGGKCTVSLLADDSATTNPWIEIDNATQSVEDTELLSEGNAATQTQLATDSAQAAAATNVAAAGTTGSPALDAIVSRRTFQRIFPDVEGSVLTYDGFLEASQFYSEFAQTPNDDINVLEVAYFLAHVAYTTDDLQYPAERGGSMYDPSKYCQRHKDCGCSSGAAYYGRGPLHLRWNFNYCLCGQALGVDLCSAPDRVLESPVMAWKTALWMWFNLGLHEAATLPDAFTRSTVKLVGDTECGSAPTNPTANAARVIKFKTIARLLNVKGLNKLTLACADNAVLLAATEDEASVTQVLANARMLSADSGATTTLSNWASVGAGAVMGVAMVGMVALAVAGRRHAVDMAHADYALVVECR